MENWLSIEKYSKLFHQYELFYDQIKQPLFRKRFIIQTLIVLNSFITPNNQFQKSKFIFSQNQKEYIMNLKKKYILYLKKKYDIYIYDLIQNEKKWSKWKENNCPEIGKKKIPEEKNIEEINSKIIEIKSNFTNFDFNYLNTKPNFIESIDKLKETKLNDLKFSATIEGLNSEVPFFGTYLEQVYKELDPDEEDENNKDKKFNDDHAFGWKFLRLLSEEDINKINTEEKYKLYTISEDYYKHFASKENMIKLNFTPPLPKMELKPKEEISLPKELLNSNIINKNENNKITDNNKIKPIISLPKDIIKDNNIINNNNNDNFKNISSNNENIKESKTTDKKEETKEIIHFPSTINNSLNNNKKLKKKKYQ